MKLSDNPRGTKVSLCPIVFVKLSDNHWGTKQSRFVPSCLWSYLTTLDVLNTLTLSHCVCEVVWPRGSKQSHFVPSCLWSCMTTLEVLTSLTLSLRACEVVWQPLRYQTVSLCPIVFVKLSDNPWGTKLSHFVLSCLWSCLTTLEVLNSPTLCLWSSATTIEVLNSLTLSHPVCEVVWRGTNQSHFSHRVCGVVWQHLRY